MWGDVGRLEFFVQVCVFASGFRDVVLFFSTFAIENWGIKCASLSFVA